jgi:RNA polymerase sigma-70 factor, ECF subfamily
MKNTDFEIIEKILKGDKHSFVVLVERYKDKSMTLAMRILHNREDAEEALQDAFIRVFKSLDNFERKSSFSTWFYRILINVCNSALQKRKNFYNIHVVDENYDSYLNTPLDTAVTDMAYESLEMKKIIQKEIDKLDPIYSTVLTLFYVQELSHDEIMKVTGLPLGTVKTRLNRARLLLKESVVKYYQESKYSRFRSKISSIILENV